MKNLKKRIKNGETVNGCWINLGSPLAAELIGHVGFDWVLIDLEHSSMAEKDVQSILQAMESSPTAVMVRVESAEPARISKVMDSGAEGIMCPKVDNAAEAKKVINGLHYPPFGKRGVAKMVRATAFGKNFQEYYESSKENSLGIIQIETVEALNNLDEIAALEGVDVLFIGPADLTMEMGIFGEFNNPIFLEAVKKIIVAANKHGKATGILFFDPNDYKKYHEMGIKFIGCGADSTFIANGAKEMAKKLSDARG